MRPLTDPNPTPISPLLDMSPRVTPRSFAKLFPGGQRFSRARVPVGHDDDLQGQTLDIERGDRDAELPDADQRRRRGR